MGTELNAVDAAESAVESGFDADGNISDENMAAALTGGDVEHVTEVQTETDVNVETKVVQDDNEPSVTDDEALVEPDTDNDDVPKGVQSKNGESIIPYEDLIKERDGRHTERDRADDLQAQLDSANKRLAEVTTPAGNDLATDKNPGAPDKGTTENQAVISKEALDEMIEDYPQAGAAIMALVKSNELLVQQVGDLTIQSKENAVVTAKDTHFNTIADAHKDYATILDSDGFKSWMDEMPAISNAAYTNVYNEGSAGDVISMVDDYLKTIPGEDTTPKIDPDKKIAAAEAKAENDNNTPVSLTDIPGSVQPHDEQSALMEMSQGNFMDKMSNLSAADQLAALDKML